jgi:hypothetical protein
MRPLAFIFPVLAFVGFAFSHDLNTLYAPGVGARAMGMGGAFVAMSGDPACLFWNPAGCAWAKKPSGYVEGAYEDRWSTVQQNYYSYPDYYSSSDTPQNYSASSTAPRAVALLVPLKEMVIGLGAYVSYETRLRDGTYGFRGQTVDPRAVGQVQRMVLSVSTGKKVGSLPKASVGFNLNYDRLHYERATYDHSVYSDSFGSYQYNSETVDMNETRFDDRGFNFDIGALVETEGGLSLGVKAGVASDWEGDGTVRNYHYYYTHQRDSLRDTTTLQEVSPSAPFKSFITSPQFITLGLRLHQENLSFDIELTAYHQEQQQSGAIGGGSGSYYYYYSPDIFTSWNLPTIRAGLEVQPLKGVFLRGGAYAYGNSGYGVEHEPAGFTGGLGYEHKGLRADLAVERQSEGDREKSTRATLGLTYALGSEK